MDEMHDSKMDPSRRALLQKGAVALGAVTVLGLTGSAASAQIAKKADQKVAGYQSSPNGGNSCANCRQFIAPSSCKVVDGTVSGNGWCKLYAKKG